MDGVAQAIRIESSYGDEGAETETNYYSKNNNNVVGVHYNDIKGIALDAGNLFCLSNSKCENINFQNIDIHSVEGFSCENIQGHQSNVKPKLCIS